MILLWSFTGLSNLCILWHPIVMQYVPHDQQYFIMYCSVTIKAIMVEWFRFVAHGLFCVFELRFSDEAFCYVVGELITAPPDWYGGSDEQRLNHYASHGLL